MIPNNLKKGDTFADGGFQYKILAVTKDGYVSKRLTDAEIVESQKKPEKKGK